LIEGQAIADYHAKIKSQEKEQPQEETAESEVVESSMLPQLETSPTEREKTLEVNLRVKQNEQTSTSAPGHPGYF